MKRKAQTLIVLLISLSTIQAYAQTATPENPPDEVDTDVEETVPADEKPAVVVRPRQKAKPQAPKATNAPNRNEKLEVDTD